MDQIWVNLGKCYKPSNIYRMVLKIWPDMLFSMGNPLVMSIFVILEYWTPFGAPWGSKRGSKGSKVAHFPTNGDQNLQIWSDMLFSIGNPLVMSISIISEYWTIFGAP
jgi:hypothetical protein